MTASATLSELDERLAVAARPGGPFDPALLSELDEQEAFPAAADALLTAAGLAEHYVPTANGGRLAAFTDPMWRLAAVAERDVTVAVAHGKTFLGAVSTWLAGDTAQRDRLARDIRAGAVVAWALTEPGHGSDLLAGEVTATRTRAGWRLAGTKWLINNATRGDLVCVLARTAPEGGARGFGTFLVDKRVATAEQYTCLPKLRTHGIRGADISGITFHDLPLPADALVGAPGSGLETTLKGLQLTRILSTALSLGAGAHGLALAAEFAADRTVAGTRLAALPHARRVLGRAAATLWVAEAVAVVAGRSVDATPAELSVVSPIAKALVPGLVDRMLAELGELLGVRGFLSRAHAHGQFQKLDRDHRIVAIFDGSTVVNRHALIGQFPLLARAYRAGRHDAPGLAALFDLPRRPESLPADRLRLLSPLGCTLVQSLPAALAEADPPSGLAADTVALVRRLGRCVDTVLAALAAHRPAPHPAAEAFDLAARYELCFAGTACLRLLLANPAVLDQTWLRACLVVITTLLGDPPGPAETAVLDDLVPAGRVPGWALRGATA